VYQSHSSQYNLVTGVKTVLLEILYDTGLPGFDNVITNWKQIHEKSWRLVPMTLDFSIQWNTSGYFCFDSLLSASPFCVSEICRAAVGMGIPMGDPHWYGYGKEWGLWTMLMGLWRSCRGFWMDVRFGGNALNMQYNPSKCNKSWRLNFAKQSNCLKNYFNGNLFFIKLSNIVMFTS